MEGGIPKVLIEFFSAGCERERDFMIDEAAPLVIFRSDNLILDFKNGQLNIPQIKTWHNLNEIKAIVHK